MAQEGEVINHIYDGNEQASAELFDEAEMAYRRALSKAPERTEALYNLGNTHVQEQDFDEAKQRFFQTQKFTENKSSKHHAFHNLGNVFMKQKDYAKAVEAYKNALRNNPRTKRPDTITLWPKSCWKRNKSNNKTKIKTTSKIKRIKRIRGTRTIRTRIKKATKIRIPEMKIRTRREIKEKTKRTKKMTGIKKKTNNLSKATQKKSNPHHPNKPNFS